MPRKQGSCAGDRRFRADVIARLARRGAIDDAEAGAAQEIRAVYLALCRGLFAHARDYGAAFAPGGRVPVSGIERLGEREAMLWREHWRPWSLEMGRVVIAGAKGQTTRLTVAIDIVIDNHGPRQSDRRHGLRHGRSLAEVRAALSRYAEVSGGFAPGGAANRRVSSAAALDAAA